MKTAIFMSYRNPDSVKIVETKKPQPKAKEVLIKVKAVAITSGDGRMLMLDFPAVFQIPFRLMLGILKPRKVLGMSFSGIVEEVGKQATKFKINDEVFGSTEMGMGCLADYITVKENGLVINKPANKSHEQAAALYFGANTALDFYHQGGLKKGDKILIYGASGALGTAGVQLAVHHGAEVTAVCGPDNSAMVKGLGAKKVTNYQAEDFSAADEQYDLVFETVGKADLKKCFSVLKPGGKLLAAVHMESSRVKEGKRLMNESDKKIIAGMVSTKYEDLVTLQGLFAKGVIDPVIDSTYPFNQIGAAFKRVVGGHKKGNVVVTP